MPEQLADIAAYICKHYPHPDELSKARLTKLVYLADWQSVLRCRQQLTKIEWYFHNYGPYVDDVVDEVRRDARFNMNQTWNPFGNRKDLIAIDDRTPEPNLSPETKSVLDFVIETTEGMSFNSFIDFVYETYPVRASERFAKLNLVELADRYAEEDE